MNPLKKLCLFAAPCLLALLSAGAQAQSTHRAGYTPNWVATPDARLAAGPAAGHAVVTSGTQNWVITAPLRRTARPAGPSRAVLTTAALRASALPGPGTVTYTATGGVQQCPVGEDLQYFYYYADVPERRAPTWCGAVDADIAVANATDPIESRKPYRVEECVAGYYWVYSHSNGGYVSGQVTSVSMVCRTQCPHGYAQVRSPDGENLCAPIVIDDQTRTPPPSDPKTQTCFANPLHPLTGKKMEFIPTGMSVGGQELHLVYDTSARLPATGDPATGMKRLNALGALWSTSFHRQLYLSVTGGSALVTRGDGTVLNFTGNGAGVFTPTAGNPHKLESITGGYRFTDVNTALLETYDTDGRLQQAASADGEVLTFTYADGDLVRVQARDGRKIQFVYGGVTIDRVIGPDLGRIATAYDPMGNLMSLTWPDGKSLGLLYENTALPWALTGKVDENNSRFATFSYDGQGRAVGSTHAGGAGNYAVNYGTPPRRATADRYDPVEQILYRTLYWEPATGIDITGPNTQSFALQSQVAEGQPVIAGRTQPAGSGCQASGSSFTYDSVGNVLSMDDFQGVRTCYAYDAANRETARVEGLAAAVACDTVVPGTATLPDGARRIDTTWHPDWRLPAQVTRPLRKTTYVYQGQPDPFNGNAAADCATAPVRGDGKPLPLLCKQVEQTLLASGTVDLAITPSVTTTRYDTAGRVLTTVDPNGRTATQAYHTSTSYTGTNTDPEFENVALLLHGAGSNGSTTITDSGFSGHTVAVAGNAQISTAQSKFGSSSIALDGTGDYLTVAASAQFSFGTGDFTVEAFVRPAVTAPEQALLSNYLNATTGWSFELNANTFHFACTGNGYDISGSTSVAANTWHHVAVARAGGTLRLFVNGALDAAVSDSQACSSTADLMVGRLGTYDVIPLNGYLQEVRITKGVARYTAAFTPPTQPFPDSGLSWQSVGQSVGDLQSVTNAVGQVNQIGLYDPAGRPRQMTDAKGVVTDVAYTPRGWVGTVTVTPPGASARVTTFSYDNAGQRTGATLPDGTALSFSYDAAHRLTGMTDTRGNTISWTLDEAGNRTRQEVRDPGGTLRRSISRSYDSLNRLQQITGAAN
ncbi:LamG-like jellyroll fold domain-containing protein [Thermomonas sp.]|uniref:LamG-like jellyroll fold domain-containing protein n=1 Tax=Thermomonas sp. TaxID=1971895 RepID=UPI0035B300BB